MSAFLFSPPRQSPGEFHFKLACRRSQRSLFQFSSRRQEEGREPVQTSLQGTHPKRARVAVAVPGQEQAPRAVGAQPRLAVNQSARMSARIRRHNACAPLNTVRLAPTPVNSIDSSEGRLDACTAAKPLPAYTRDRAHGGRRGQGRRSGASMRTPLRRIPLRISAC